MSQKQPYYPNASTERAIIMTIIIIMAFAGYCAGRASAHRDVVEVRGER